VGLVLKFAEIAVDAPAGYGRTFSYSIPDGLVVNPGHLVIVPFGPRSRQGIVIEVSGEPQVEKTRDIIEISDTRVLVDPLHLKIISWLSEYYMCSLFEAASLMIPPGIRTREIIWISASGSKRSSEETFKISRFQGDIMEYLGTNERFRLDKIVSRFGRGARSAIKALEEYGLVVRHVERSRTSVSERFKFVPRVTKAAVDALNKQELDRAHKQKEFIQTLQIRKNDLTMPEARKLFGASAVNSVLKKGFITQEKIQIFRDPLRGKIYDAAPSLSLREEQEEALCVIKNMLQHPEHNPRAILLYGVTGSGKTEVYIEAVKECIALGKNAIVLVPEIALTPQTIQRFESRFQGQVAISHSGLSVGERYDQWWKIKNGEYQVVIGSRGAIFAPLPDIGLIVLDEEHEWTYKQNESSPRYHAREVAMQIAGISRSVVLLGSASPDLESFIRSKRGRYEFAELRQRFIPHSRVNDIGRSELASVSVVDMREELKVGNRDILSRSLYQSIDETLKLGEQIILFLNRRGASSFVQCRSCGSVIKCGSCDISLTYHSQYDRLVCHYCGRNRLFPSNCPSCTEDSLGRYGLGTQSVAKRIDELFPDANALRWDRDVATRPKQYESIIDQFSSRSSSILIGTQLVAKGHHFPNVTLVGVISADIGLNMPDFRSGEKVFQTLCQVSGRAGRGERPGKVIIQTYQPEHYAVVAASKQDYRSFFDMESAYRKLNAYPPFTRLIRLVREDTNNSRAEKQAKGLVNELFDERNKWGLSDTDVFGPLPAFPSRVKGRYRWQIILKGPNPRILLDKVNQLAYDGNRAEGLNGWSVDINPVSVT